MQIPVLLILFIPEFYRMRRWRISKFSVNRCITLVVLNIELYSFYSIFVGIHVRNPLLLMTVSGPGFRPHLHNVKKWLTFATDDCKYLRSSVFFHVRAGLQSEEAGIPFRSED